MNRLQLIEAVDQGMSDAEVADRFGVSGRTVLRWRIRYGIPSQWVPLGSPHGTPARYRAGCRCASCRAATARARRLYVARAQRTTAAAPRWREPWTRREDAYLLDPANGSVIERALALGRTFDAATLRLRRLNGRR